MLARMTAWGTSARVADHGAREPVATLVGPGHRATIPVSTCLQPEIAESKVSHFRFGTVGLREETELAEQVRMLASCSSVKTTA